MTPAKPLKIDEGFGFVMPVQADIQENVAPAFGYASWIPGLALLARNDGASVYSLYLSVGPLLSFTPRESPVAEYASDSAHCGTPIVPPFGTLIPLLDHRQC